MKKKNDPILSFKTRIEGEDYRFRDDLDYDPNNTCPIELIESGLIIRLGEVSINDVAGEKPELAYRYNIISNPNNVEVTKDIAVLIGDVLVTLIIQKIKSEENDESRENNTIKSDTE